MYQYPYGNAQQLNLDWILGKIQEIEAGSTEVNIEEVANALIAASFDAGVSYRRYDYCFYNGKLYRALNDTSGAFNPADWLEVVIGDDIPVLTRLINAVDTSLTTLQGTVGDQGTAITNLQNTLNENLKFPNKIKVLTSSDDLNDYYSEANSGWYELRDNVVNAPASYCRCLVIGGNGASQVVFTTNHVYVRMYTGTPLAWSAWETIPNLTELTAEATTRSNADFALQNAINGLLGNKIHTFSQNFNFNASGNNEYTGLNITFPANCVYAMTACLYYIASQPVQISINTSDTDPNAVNIAATYVSPVASCAFASWTGTNSPATKYIWAKYANSGANQAVIFGYYIELS